MLESPHHELYLFDEVSLILFWLSKAKTLVDF